MTKAKRAKKRHRQKHPSREVLKRRALKRGDIWAFVAATLEPAKA